ncbi:CBO0543 family protein [Alkalihalobacillus sp. CinArs1]|uniref:CBO0543 family protein n=1 Tax=Alkalihalobacillus sp. CinArs1 TaxID=2995314 RepID=UPI0022DCFE75|nr:CBO0543 family protein [Alkalihalobacillus sp. CinArs1]
MISIFVSALFLLASIRYGDWKNWQRYYPTMLYMVINAVLYNVITYEYPTWEWEDVTGVFPNHTLLDFWIIFTQFPVVVLIYLTNYPTSFKKRLIRFLVWVGIFSGLEAIVLQVDYIVYNNDWSLWWSILFNVTTFTFIPLHQRHPIFTWVLSFVFIAMLCMIFEVPLVKMR